MYTDIHKTFHRISEGHWSVYEFQADNPSTRSSFQVFPVGIQMIRERIFRACCNVEFALYWTNKRGGMSFVTPGFIIPITCRTRKVTFFPVSIVEIMTTQNKNGIQNIFNQICLIGFVVLLMSNIFQPFHYIFHFLLHCPSKSALFTTFSSLFNYVFFALLCFCFAYFLSKMILWI